MCNQSKILSNDEVVSNEQIDIDKLNKAKSILIKLQKELENYISLGHGPFLAAIYDENENLIAKCSNSVINDNCSNCHAEVNVIKEAEKNQKMRIIQQTIEYIIRLANISIWYYVVVMF